MISTVTLLENNIKIEQEKKSQAYKAGYSFVSHFHDGRQSAFREALDMLKEELLDNHLKMQQEQLKQQGII